MGIIENEKEMLALLSVYGILFFTVMELKLVEFIPLAECVIKMPRDKGAYFFDL